MSKSRDNTNLKMHRTHISLCIGRFLAVIVLVFILVSCGGDTWTSEQQDIFLKECDTEGGSSSYCKCYLEKVKEKYPVYADSKKLDFESAVEMAKSCE